MVPICIATPIHDLGAWCAWRRRRCSCECSASYHLGTQAFPLGTDLRLSTFRALLFSFLCDELFLLRHALECCSWFNANIQPIGGVATLLRDVPVEPNLEGFGLAVLLKLPVVMSRWYLQTSGRNYCRLLLKRTVAAIALVFRTHLTKEKVNVVKQMNSRDPYVGGRGDPHIYI